MEFNQISVFIWRSLGCFCSFQVALFNPTDVHHHLKRVQAVFQATVSRRALTRLHRGRTVCILMRLICRPGPPLCLLFFVVVLGGYWCEAMVHLSIFTRPQNDAGVRWHTAPPAGQCFKKNGSSQCKRFVCQSVGQRVKSQTRQLLCSWARSSSTLNKCLLNAM